MKSGDTQAKEMLLMWDIYLDSNVYSVKNDLTTMNMFDLAKGEEVRREIVIMITITVINKGGHFKGKKH